METSTGYVDAGVWTVEKAQINTLLQSADTSSISTLSFASLKQGNCNSAILAMSE
jgi:hypothetical protein